MKIKYIFYAPAFLLCFSQCKKMVEVDPPATSVTGPIVFATDATAIAALTGIYASMSAISLVGTSTAGAGAGLTSLSLYPGLSADELRLLPSQSNSTYLRYYKNGLSTNPVLSLDFWNKLYPVVYSANAAIDALNSSPTLSSNVKEQLLGEAKFMRAFAYFYLVNLYGDLPLVKGINFEENAILAKSAKADIYQLIIKDLTEAKQQLNAHYLDGSLQVGTAERVRPTTWAATALLSRVYLYSNQWAEAEAKATEIINNVSDYSLVNLTDVFLMNSQEAIWQLQPVSSGWNTWEARMFNLPASGPNNSTYPVYLNTPLLNSFETGDNRKTTWIKSVTTSSGTYYYSNKYKSSTLNAGITEYSTVLRLAEQFLIRSEARAQQDNIFAGLADLNAIRRRAGLTDTSITSKANLIAGILHEKQVELFTEWGHRWFDLKRSGTIDSVMSVVAPLKGGTWETTDGLYPISNIELQRNKNLKQNSGY